MRGDVLSLQASPHMRMCNLSINLTLRGYNTLELSRETDIFQLQAVPKDVL